MVMILSASSLVMSMSCMMENNLEIESASETLRLGLVPVWGIPSTNQRDTVMTARSRSDWAVLIAESSFPVLGSTILAYQMLPRRDK